MKSREFIENLEKKLHLKSPEYQLREISRIQNLEGNVIGAIDILGKMEYCVGGNTWIGIEQRLDRKDIEIIGLVAKSNLNKFLETYNLLREKLNYKGYLAGILGHAKQTKKVLKISQSGGDVSGAIDTLWNIGYSLFKSVRSGSCNVPDKGCDGYLHRSDVETIGVIAKADQDRFKKVFEYLTKYFSYNKEHLKESYRNTQIKRIYKISQIEGDVLGRIIRMEKEGLSLVGSTIYSRDVNRIRDYDSSQTPIN
mgnify:FL=1